MARSRTSTAKKQTRERFRMIMLYITCCGRKPTVEELDGDIIEEKEPHKVGDIPNARDDNVKDGDNGAGDTCSPKPNNPKRSTLPPRPPPPKRPFRPTKPGRVVKGGENKKAKGDVKPHDNNTGGIGNEHADRPERYIPKRPQPGRGPVPPKRPPPPMKATSTHKATPPLKATPPKKATPPMRPPPPASHLIAELLERNRKMAITALRLDDAQSDTTAKHGPVQSQVNLGVSDKSASQTKLDDYPAEMNPFSEDDDADDEKGGENKEVVIIVDKKDITSQTNDDYPDELNPFSDDDD